MQPLAGLVQHTLHNQIKFLLLNSIRASKHPEPIDVLQLPSDVAQYQDVQQLYQEVQSYQQHFVELHRATTAATPTGEDPAALKVKLVQLDSQKQQLQDKLLKIRGKVQNVANLPALQVQFDSTCTSIISTLMNKTA